MSTQVQYRRGTGAQNDAFTGALAEITVDTTALTLRVHDGITAGGSNLATVDYVDNAISSLSANSITAGTSSVAIIAANGNVRTNVAGSTISTVYSGGVLVTGVTSVSGNVTGGNVLTGGLMSATGNVNGGNVISAALVQGVTLSATGNVIGGNVTTAGLVSATGNVNGGNVIGAALVQGVTLSATGNVQGGNLRTAGLISATGAITGAGITGTSLTVTTGNVTAGNIVNGNANGVGNIGSSGTYFNTVFAKATSAQYADLAEYYIADAEYPVGTVLRFGGDSEVTQSTSNHVTSIAGTVSDQPAYAMNSGLDHPFRTPVALMGRVPCRVVGTIRKGDRLVASDIAGVATALDPALYQPGCIIGKALEDFDSAQPGMIEVVVGRL